MTNPSPMTKAAREEVLRELLSDDHYSDSTFWHQIFGIAHSYVVAKPGEAIPDREPILEQALAWVGDFLREGLIKAHFAKSYSETGADSGNPAVASMSCEETVTKIRTIVHKEWVNQTPSGQSGVTDDEYFCWFNLTELGRQRARELYLEEAAANEEDTKTTGIMELLAHAVQGGRFSIESARRIKQYDWRNALQGLQAEVRKEAESLFYFIEGFVEEVDEGYVSDQDDPELHKRILELLQKL
jgi:hypothetical protein